MRGSDVVVFARAVERLEALGVLEGLRESSRGRAEGLDAGRARGACRFSGQSGRCSDARGLEVGRWARGASN